MKHEIFTGTWWVAAGVRAVRTMAQTLTALLASAVVLADVEWQVTASATVLAGILSVATSVGGLPEVERAGQDGDIE